MRPIPPSGHEDKHSRLENIQSAPIRSGFRRFSGGNERSTVIYISAPSIHPRLQEPAEKIPPLEGGADADLVRRKV